MRLGSDRIIRLSSFGWLRRICVPISSWNLSLPFALYLLRRPCSSPQLLPVSTSPQRLAAQLYSSTIATRFRLSHAAASKKKHAAKTVSWLVSAMSPYGNYWPWISSAFDLVIMLAIRHTIEAHSTPRSVLTIGGKSYCRTDMLLPGRVIFLSRTAIWRRSGIVATSGLMCSESSRRG